MQQLPVSSIATATRPTLRDWAAVGFRRRRLIMGSFLTVFGAVALIALFMPREYEAEMKILVKNERAEPVVTPDKDPLMPPREVTEQDLNSEVQLLKSRDLLEKVAIATGAPADDTSGVYEATKTLEKNLTVEPVRKTKLIPVAYRSRNPLKAQRVLETLNRLYFEKHLEVHRPPGALHFFQAQTDQYKKQLDESEAAVAKFAAESGVIEPPLSREITVRKLNEAEADLKQTRAAVAATEQRIRALEQEQSAAGPRVTTAVRTSSNPYLLEHLRTTLLNLELKRTELLNKYAPAHRLVREAETQIAQTREALDSAEKNPVREETTDRDATHEWIKSELAKARAELKASQTKVASTAQIVGQYRDQARKLNETGIAQQDLVRKAKTAEDNYLLYSKKQEEARISNALDEQRIVNVSLAQPAMVPPLPAKPHRLLNIALGFLLALLVSIALALTAEYVDRSFRTPHEVELFLNVPVLAALPANCDSGDAI